MKKTSTSSLTEGNVLRSLLLFALPMIGGNLLQQVYNITDTLIVGKFIGTDALAAVGSAYTLMTFLTSLIIGLCMGSGALFSSSFGGKRYGEMKKDMWLSFWFILASSVVIISAVYIFIDGIIGLMHIPQNIVSLSRDYLGIIFAGIIFTFLYNFFAYSLRSVGNSRVPLYFLIISSVMNTVLDLIFVITLDMGISGAALATVISQAFSGAGIVVFTFVKFPLLRFGWDSVCFSFARLKRIIVNDIFTALQQSVMNLGILMIQGLVNTFGTDIMAAFAAAVKIDTLAYLPAQEFANAYSLFVSQNYGAGRADRIHEADRKAILTSSVFCVCVSALVFVLAEQLMGIFIDSSEAGIIASGVRYLHIEGSTYIGIGILFLMYGYYRAVDRPYMSLVLTIISLGTRVLLSYTLAPNTPLGVTAIWMSIPVGWFLADATGLTCMRLKRFRPERKEESVH